MTSQKKLHHLGVMATMFFLWLNQWWQKCEPKRRWISTSGLLIPSRTIPSCWEGWRGLGCTPRYKWRRDCQESVCWLPSWWSLNQCYPYRWEQVHPCSRLVLLSSKEPSCFSFYPMMEFLSYIRPCYPSSWRKDTYRSLLCQGISGWLHCNSKIKD